MGKDLYFERYDFSLFLGTLLEFIWIFKMYSSENYKRCCLLIRLDGLGHGLVFGTPFDLGLNLVLILVLVTVGHGSVRS